MIIRGMAEIERRMVTSLLHVSFPARLHRYDAPQQGFLSTGIIIPYFIEVHTEFDLVMFARSFIGVPVELALWFMTRYLLDGLALLSGEMARALLSPGGVDVTVQSGQLYAVSMSQQALHVYAAPGRND